MFSKIRNFEPTDIHHDIAQTLCPLTALIAQLLATATRTLRRRSTRHCASRRMKIADPPAQSAAAFRCAGRSTPRDAPRGLLEAMAALKIGESRIQEFSVIPQDVGTGSQLWHCPTRPPSLWPRGVAACRRPQFQSPQYRIHGLNSTSVVHVLFGQSFLVRVDLPVELPMHLQLHSKATAKFSWGLHEWAARC